MKFNEIESACLFLTVLALSGKEYIKISYELNRRYDHSFESVDDFVTSFSLDMDEYNDWLTYQVHSQLIYCAIQLRIVLEQDNNYIEKNNAEIDPITRLQTESYNLFKPIVKHSGFSLTTLRECCNKIIHADNIDLICSNYNEVTSHSPWNGEIKLSGKHQQKPWELIIDVPKFCFTIRYYLSEVRYLY